MRELMWGLWFRRGSRFPSHPKGGGAMSFRLTFRPGFYASRNSSRNEVEEKDIGAFGPGSCTEFRCGSCWRSHLGWRYHICKNLPGDAETHSKTPMRETQIQGFKYIHSYDKGFWNHTRQYTFVRQRILKSYQAIYILIVKDPEIIPGNILSYNRGSWNHTRQYTFWGLVGWSNFINWWYRSNDVGW